MGFKSRFILSCQRVTFIMKVVKIISLLASQKSRKSKYLWHKIFSPRPHPNSFASYILLKKEYEDKDSSILFKKRSWRFWLTFRNRFLKRLQKQNPLECVYCGSKPLVRNNQVPVKIKENRKATIDHVVPVSKGGKEFSLDNLVVCCARCNRKKADLDLKDFAK